jgi:hypothetical protein
MKNRVFALMLRAALIVWSGAGVHTAVHAQTESGATIPEQSTLQFSAGVRMWVNKWDVPFGEFTPTIVNGVPAVRSESKTRLSGTEVVPMPTIGVNYGRWFAGATYFPETSYDTKGGLRSEVRREELDLNVGYALIPGPASLSVSIGYKRTKQDRITDDPFSTAIKANALLIGLSGTAPLKGALSLYGNAAYGFARLKADIPDPSGSTRFDADYQIGELGIRYTFGSLGQQFLKNLVISVGYRYQLATAHGIVVDATTSLVGPPTVLASDKRDFRQYTAGPVIALVAFF